MYAYVLLSVVLLLLKIIQDIDSFLTLEETNFFLFVSASLLTVGEVTLEEE